MTEIPLENLAQEPPTIGNGKVIVDAVKVHLAKCCHTREVLAIPIEIHEKVARNDPTVRDKQFDGFYVSPGFFYYATREDFRNFCED